MQITKLFLLNVRNHVQSRFELADETVFTGSNGSGKTTVLEAIYLLYAMRGFKKQPLSGVTSFGMPFMRIEAETKSGEYTTELILTYDGKKLLTADGTPVESISDFIFDHPIACHTPENPGILSREQSERRGFADRYIFYSEKCHIDDVRLYNRLIAQKTAEMEADFPDRTYIDVINDEIINISARISERRKNFIAKINSDLKKVYDEAAFKAEPVFISYSTNINNKDLLKNEIYKKRCDYGVHRDRIDMCLDDKLIEKFSSFGQKKTFSLLALLSAVKNIEEVRKISIITLLDDFEAGLDRDRATLLKNQFSSKRQTVYSGVENIRLGFKNTIFLEG